MKKQIRKIVIAIICIVISLVIFWQAIFPLFQPGLYPTIDNIVVVRIEDMARELSRGQFPVRYSGDLARERGYMLFNFYAPLPFYAGAYAYEAGVNLVGALKRMYLVAFVIAAAGMFVLAKQFFGRIPGAVAAIFFIFSPYLGYDVYWRGGLGEVWAISFLPLTFWLFYKTVQSGNKTFISLSAFSFAAIILSHNLTTFMIFPLLILWILGLWRVTKGHLFPAIVGLILGLGIAAFFWIPAFVEKSNVWVSYLQMDKTTFLEDSFRSTWQSHFFPSFIPMIMNWIYLTIPFVSIILLILLRRKNISYISVHTRIIVLITSLFALFGIFMATEFSKFLWDGLYNFLYIFQFAWRFFIVVIFFSSLLAAWIVFVIGKGKTVPMLIIAAIIVPGLIWYELPNFRPTTYLFIDKYKAEDPCGTTWGYEYLPVSVTTCIRQNSYAPELVIGGNAKITSVERGTRSYRVTTEGEKNRLRIDKYYYPGWEAAIDGKKAPIFYDNPYGIIEIGVPAGKHTVVLTFTDTPLRTAGNILSLTAIIATLLLLIAGIKKRLSIHKFLGGLFSK